MISLEKLWQNQVRLEELEPRFLLSGNPDLWPLPLPTADVASDPAMQPSVVTAGGQRLLLTYFNNTVDTSTNNGIITAATTSGPLGSPVTVTYDPQTDSLISNKPGWWIINFPLDQIQGLPNILNNTCGMTDQQIKDTVAQDLFGAGKTASTVQNWYILTPVDADHPLAPSPTRATEPAPITSTNLSNSYVLVVDQNYSGSPSQEPVGGLADCGRTERDRGADGVQHDLGGDERDLRRPVLQLHHQLGDQADGGAGSAGHVPRIRVRLLLPTARPPAR